VSGDASYRVIVSTADADPEELADRVGGVLYELGLGASSLEEHEGTLVVWTSAGPQHDAMDLAEAFGAEGLSVERVETVAPDPVDWNEQWKVHFQPLRIGPLWIGPTWHAPPADAERVLRLDPSMAFGTGLHPSTRLVLEALVDAGPRSDLLDVGVGSGILALAALRLDTPSAVGTDRDPEALRVAAENARANDLADRLALSPAAPDALGRTFSTVVANILAQPLIDLAPSIARATASSGRVILAGLLVRQVESVQAAYAAAGLAPRTTRTQGEWALLELGRP